MICSNVQVKEWTWAPYWGVLGSISWTWQFQARLHFIHWIDYVFQEPVVPCSGQVKNQVWRRRWVYHRVKGSADLRLWCRKCINQMYFLKKKYQQLTVLAAVTPSAIGSTSTRDCFPTFSEKEDWIRIGKLLKVNRTLPLKTRYTFIFFPKESNVDFLLLSRYIFKYIKIYSRYSLFHLCPLILVKIFLSSLNSHNRRWRIFLDHNHWGGFRLGLR